MQKNAWEKYDAATRGFVADDAKAMKRWAEVEVKGGVPRWKANDSIPMPDALSQWNRIGMKFDYDKSVKAYQKQTAAHVADLMAMRQKKESTAALLARLREQMDEGLVSGFKAGASAGSGLVSKLFGKPAARKSADASDDEEDAPKKAAPEGGKRPAVPPKRSKAAKTPAKTSKPAPPGYKWVYGHLRKLKK